MPANRQPSRSPQTGTVLRTWSLFCLLIGTALLAIAPTVAQDDTPRIVVLSIDGTITPAMAQYVDRGIREAEDDAVDAIVLEIDTPGGLSSAMDDIVRDITESEVPVIAWVAPRGAKAASAGVFITYASHVAAMAPGTSIGSASPVTSDGSDMSETMRAKVTNDAVSTIRNLANLRGRNADWAESAVRDASNLTADDALAQDVIDLTAPDLGSLLAATDGLTVTMNDGSTVTLRTAGAETSDVGMNPIEALLQRLADPTIAYLLMSFGALGIFLELGNPGTFVPGIVGVVCLVLGLYSLGTLPVNWTGGMLILIAFALFFIDLFVNAFGLLLVSGLTCFVIGSYMLIDPSVPGYPEVSRPVIWFSAALILASGFMIGTAVLRVMRRKPVTGRAALIGEVGMARTSLEPDGMIFLQGELWSASSGTGSAIAAGSHVRVTEVNGLRLVVEPTVAPVPAFDERRPRGEGVLPVRNGLRRT